MWIAFSTAAGMLLAPFYYNSKRFLTLFGWKPLIAMMGIMAAPLAAYAMLRDGSAVHAIVTVGGVLYGIGMAIFYIGFSRVSTLIAAIAAQLIPPLAIVIAWAALGQSLSS